MTATDSTTVQASLMRLNARAWGIATTEYDGTFDGSPVNFVSAQLAVLTRQDGAWRIRSVHWSSRRR